MLANLQCAIDGKLRSSGQLKKNVASYTLLRKYTCTLLEEQKERKRGKKKDEQRTTKEKRKGNIDRRCALCMYNIYRKEEMPVARRGEKGH